MIGELIRLIAATLLFGSGIVIIAVATIGIFRFDYCLNRMHSAAMGDTLGLLLCLAGIIVLTGFNMASVKLALIIVFLWLASPVSSHLISRLETTTNEHLDKHVTKEKRVYKWK